MDPQLSPRPEEDDVRLSIQFHDLRLEFAACTTAAERFVQEWRAYHHQGAVTVIPGNPAGLPRLPTERLHLEGQNQDRRAVWLGESRSCDDRRGNNG
ncbi:hypothetical protein U3653_06175 [Nocardia sp. CDC186]|uniref:Uncharacterized protein n=1 Tax=Nocardia implantans TaxID=3108168 RepID=A0ABU6AQ48_9NOCA|nr:hypothetical protein [Nocardia sp. CDC186]MEB3509599.1 hypothetical protein [Nocardia sp. CDC186]